MVSCKRCGKRLTNPKSLERGYGPICWGKISAGDFGKKLKPRHNWLDRYEYTKEEEQYWIKCRNCNMPMFHQKYKTNWEGLPCISYCCACCPNYKDDICPKEQKFGGVIRGLLAVEALNNMTNPVKYNQATLLSLFAPLKEDN